jgi:hypothetical protein
MIQSYRGGARVVEIVVANDVFIRIKNLSCTRRCECVSKVLVAIFRIGKACKGPKGAALVVLVVGYQLHPVRGFGV